MYSIDSRLDIKKLKTDLNNNNFIMYSNLYTPELSAQTQNLKQKLGQVIEPLSELIQITDDVPQIKREELIKRIVISSLELEIEAENIRQELANLTNKLIQT